MPILCIGKTEIPYEIRLSIAAKRKRIIISPGKVEVVAPDNTNEQDIALFVNKKKQWIYDNQEEMNEALARYEQDSYIRLQSGAKIPFRGRNMRVRIHSTQDRWSKIEYRNGFSIYIPERFQGDDIESCAGMAITFWLKDRLKEDVKQLVSYYSKRLGLKYRSIKIRNPDKLWASCTKSGVIVINWHLIAAPKSVLEYVILHEICHLKYRNHSKEFWLLLATHMPEYLSRKKWLERSNPHYNL